MFVHIAHVVVVHCSDLALGGEKQCRLLVVLVLDNGKCWHFEGYCVQVLDGACVSTRITSKTLFSAAWFETRTQTACPVCEGVYRRSSYPWPNRPQDIDV